SVSGDADAAGVRRDGLRTRRSDLSRLPAFSRPRLLFGRRRGLSGADLERPEDPGTQNFFRTIAVPLRHDREETLRPRGRGGDTDPLGPTNQPVPLHLPEPGKDVVMRDPEVLGKFPGRREP